MALRLNTPCNPLLELERTIDEDALSACVAGREASLSTTDTDGSDFDEDDVSCGTVEHRQSHGTIIILDWDDTLCPSSFLEGRCGLSVDGPPPDDDVAEALEEFASEIGALLGLAQELASRVVVVTNACDGWVEASCQAWMPQLQGALEKIKVSSARSNWEPTGVDSPTSWKAREFETLIGRPESWKNVIVVGDAPYEHDALQRVVKRAPGSESLRCRSKSVKFAYKPSIEELSLEIQALRSHLRDIIDLDDSFHLTVSSEGISMMTPIIASDQSAETLAHSFFMDGP
jgi:hypothetical protein